ncbi:unnamed protein product [Leptidea sinapis]|uniref:Uncharacterized protein n=1 Tax=Leptidea sinapis TaxID=189913 RepID=A0A5E4QG40_9NEOP|nr:unnamed protein product [Leptidea sinapis]
MCDGVRGRYTKTLVYTFIHRNARCASSGVSRFVACQQVTSDINLIFVSVCCCIIVVGIKPCSGFLGSVSTFIYYKVPESGPVLFL